MRATKPGGEAARAPRALAPWDRATLALLAALGAVAALVAGDFGPTWDEGFQREIGQAVLAWYRSGFADPRALAPGATGNFHLYGGLFEAAAELAAEVLPLDPFHARHLATALCALAGIAAAALLARRLAGPRAGFLAAALLALAGPWVGHAFANPKDIPFAAGYALTLLALLRAADGLPRPGPGGLAAAAAALGATLGVRPAGALLLLPLAAGVWAARARAPLAALPRGERGRAAARTVLALGAVAAVAWAIMLAGWPFGQLGPLTRPLLALRETAASVPDAPVHFAGEWFTPAGLPRTYLPTWLLATLPEAWLVAAALAAVAALAAARGQGPDRRAGAAPLEVLLVAGAALAPVAAAIAARPPLYDGLRHFLFVLPPLAAVLAAGASRGLEALPAAAGRAAAGLLAAAALLAARDLAALHPYEYVHFNRLVAGGVARGTARHEGDFWSASVREAVARLLALPGPAGRPLRVAVSGPPFLVEHWIRAAGATGRAEVAPAWEADVLLATTRWARHKTPGRVLFVVERLGAPLLYAIALPPPLDPAPRRLSFGTATLDLPLPAGWLAEPRARAGAREPYFLATSPAGAHLELAPLPAAEAADLREAAVAEARLELGGAVPGPPRRLEGPGLDGWWLQGAGAGGEERLAGAARSGGVAVSFRGAGAPSDLAAALAGLAGARAGPPADRPP